MDDQEQHDEVQFVCCYCGQGVPRDQTAHFTLQYQGEEQYWFGHAGCFILALQPAYRVLRPEWEDEFGYLTDWPSSPGPSPTDSDHTPE